MKYIFITFILSLSLTSHAESGDMGGGRSIIRNNILTISNSSIEAVISKSGIYSRLIDIQEGFENFEGIKVNKIETQINLSKPSKVDIDRLILSNGREIDIKNYHAKASSGDMGGG